MNTLLLRRWHGYLGAFIAPSIIFFALTGALQLFNLHEAHDGYRPAPIVEKLSRVHKDQLFALEEHHEPPPGPRGASSAANPPSSPGDHDEPPATSTVLLKWFFLVVALGLALSTSFGVWIGLTRPGGRRTTIALLAAGAVIPLVLLVA